MAKIPRSRRTISVGQRCRVIITRNSHRGAYLVKTYAANRLRRTFHTNDPDAARDVAAVEVKWLRRQKPGLCRWL